MEASLRQFQPEDGAGTMIEILTQARRRLEIHREQITSAIETITRVVEGCGTREVEANDTARLAPPSVPDEVSNDIVRDGNAPGHTVVEGGSRSPERLQAPVSPSDVRASVPDIGMGPGEVVTSCPNVPTAPGGTATTHSSGELYSLVVDTMTRAGRPLLAREIRDRLAEDGHSIPAARVFALCQKRVESSKMSKDERGFSLVLAKL